MSSWNDLRFGGGRVKPPCKGCTDKVPNVCRSTCERWKQYEADKEIDRQQQFEYREKYRGIYLHGAAQKAAIKAKERKR